MIILASLKAMSSLSHLLQIAPKVTDEDVDVSVGDKADNKLLIPKGTPIAYNLCELAVKEDGSLELMVESDALGGFEDTTDSVDGSYEEGILEGGYKLGKKSKYLSLYSTATQNHLRLLGPPTPQLCVTYTNMLVSKNAKICVTPMQTLKFALPPTQVSGI